jgi:DNA-binding SARP family transcriptional activator/WD40 repeat protein/molybdopterin-guanine dinucleotide biosynthesis protein
VRFKVLGSISAETDGAAVAIGGPRQRRLLGLLVLARGQTVSVDRLVDALWPDGDAPEGAARSVMTYVSRLRAALGDGQVVTAGAGYRLPCEQATIDAYEFAALVAEAESALPDQAVEWYAQALSLWDGSEAFGEFAGEWWALAEATRLAELRVVAREEHAAALIGIGHPSRAVPDLEGLLVEQPLRERPANLLMHALVATGRQAEALRVFRAYRSRLAEETGLDPSPDLVQLERTISGSLEPADELSAGRPLRGYVIHEAIGEGTYGRVYAATQPGTERRVAIKVIRPDLADSAQFIRRFEAEARLVARLEHPHIVPLYDYWREPGGAYLVFRYLAGGTARDSVITGGAWSLPRVSQLVEEIGGALIAAHAAGVLHNDVKSNNVMLDDRGSAYLTDFGIAVGADDPSAVGTDEHDDVRGFGWVLWELLTGEPATAAVSRSSIAGRRRRGTAPSLIGQMTAVPDGLDAVLAKATVAEGGYATVAEVVLAWRAAVGRPEGVLSPLTSDDRRVVDSARRSAALQLTRATAAGVNPYQGLRPFDEADAAVFFGRDAVIDDLEEAVGRHRLVTVVGASGSGKSSLVRAGLVPRLREQGHTVVTMVPGDDPVAALRQALSEVSVRRGKAPDLTALIGHVVAKTGPLVVVVDQFEECWTRAEADRRSELIDAVARLVDGGTDVRFVATIRADVFDRPLQEPRLGEQISAGTFVLAPLTPAQLGDAITLPAARAGVTVDEPVVADLVTDAAAQPGSLPLLQFTLAELYDRRVDGRIGPDALAAVGGMAGSIGRRAEEVFLALDEPAQDDTRELFSRLVTPGDGIPDARRRARLSELSEGARSVADQYVTARLLVTDRDQVTREPTVEVAHEALLTRWPRLATWIDADRRWLTQLQHLATSAQAWDDRGRPEADLYRGARLESAIEALDADGRAVSGVERQFVDAGHAARDSELREARRSARRLRRLLTAVGALLVVALVAGTVAFVQRRQADENAARAATAADEAERAGREAETNADEAEAAAAVAETAERDAAHRALVSNSVALRANKRDIAALLAIEAHRLAPSPATESALFGTFTAAPRLEGTVRPEIEEHGGDAVMLDNETIGLQEMSGSVHVVDARTGAAQYSLELLDADDGYAVWMSATPDARYLATAWRNNDNLAGRGEFSVWDLETRQRRFANVDVPFAMGAVAISRDGSLVAIAGGPDARTLIYDAATGELRVELEPIPRPDDATLVSNTVAVAFTQDGDLIVGSQAGPIRVVDPATGRELRRINAEQEVSEADMRVSRDGRSLVTLGWRGMMRYDLRSGTPLWPQVVATEGCAELGYAEAIGVALCGEGSGRVRTVDLESGAPSALEINQGGGICQLMDSPDGSTLVQTNCSSTSYVIWRLDGGGAVSRTVVPTTGEHFVFAYTTDGRGLLAEVLEDDGSVVTQLVDTATADVEPLPGIYGPAPTDDPARVIGIFEDGTGGQYDLETRRRVGPAVRLGYEPWGALVSGDTTFAWGEEALPSDEPRRFHFTAVDTEGRIVFDVEQDQMIVDAATIDPGHLVTVECPFDCMFQRRDPRTGAALGNPVSREIEYVVVVSRGATLIAVTALGEVHVLDPDTLSPVGDPLPGLSSSGAGALSLSDDGRRLLLLGSDDTLRLYDVPSRTQLGDAIDVGVVAGAAIRPDGMEAAVTTDQGIVVWDLDAEHWVEGACAIAGRNLTRAEWDQYIGDLAPYRATCPQFETGE